MKFWNVLEILKTEFTFYKMIRAYYGERKKGIAKNEGREWQWEERIKDESDSWSNTYSFILEDDQF